MAPLGARAIVIPFKHKPRFVFRIGGTGRKLRLTLEEVNLAHQMSLIVCKIISQFVSIRRPYNLARIGGRIRSRNRSPRLYLTRIRIPSRSYRSTSVVMHYMDGSQTEVTGDGIVTSRMFAVRHIHFGQHTGQRCTRRWIIINVAIVCHTHLTIHRYLPITIVRGIPFAFVDRG